MPSLRQNTSTNGDLHYIIIVRLFSVFYKYLLKRWNILRIKTYFIIFQVKKQIIKKEENVSDVKFELFNQSSKNDWEGFEEPNDFHFNNDLYDQGESLCDFKNVYCESIQPINQNLISKTEDNTVIHFPLETEDYIEGNTPIKRLK